MIVHVPNQRQHATRAGKPFNDLIDYIEEDVSQEHKEVLAQTAEFSDIINYAVASLDKGSQAEKCIALRAHGVASIATAAEEMNAVAARNTRVKDPVFHFILSWPEHERPSPEAIFDAAEHALAALGLSEHQYVLAVHGNTDNTHCHIAVNRIHPETFRSRHLEWTNKTLHYAARESEIKHGWSHDNGIYIVETDKRGLKKIILNKDFSDTVGDLSESSPKQRPSRDSSRQLPTWHDPESLESWLKTDVAKLLKRDLRNIHDWSALHNWLSQYEITLTDTGGGGMRLHATSTETGEILSIPASKGLRLLKRSDLEKKWGAFQAAPKDPVFGVSSFPEDYPSATPQQDASPSKLFQGDFPDEVAQGSLPTDTSQKAASAGDSSSADTDRGLPVVTPCIVPDFGHLTPKQIQKGIEHVLRAAPDGGIPPVYHHVLHAEPDRRIPATHRRGSLHELPGSAMDGDGRDREMLLSGSVRLHLGDEQARQNPNLRRPGASESGRGSGRGHGDDPGLKRDPELRAQRREERAAARRDLRQRYAQYRRFLYEGDTDYWLKLQQLQAGQTATLRDIRTHAKAARATIRKNPALSDGARLLAIAAINATAVREKLQAEEQHLTRAKALRATRQPPLGWREWLHEQAQLGDKAALSALRGIVYQAQRDAKHRGTDGQLQEDPDPTSPEEQTLEEKERKHRKLMEQLLEEERRETAIRAAQQNAMRPYQVDALLVRYSGMHWRVTGNGNVEYLSDGGHHIFTDRGNRITFDRELVTDDEIRLALLHAGEKFGGRLTLTGEDPVFTARMVRLADDLGLIILNPELQPVIEAHRATKVPQFPAAADTAPHASHESKIAIPAPAADKVVPQPATAPVAESAADLFRTPIDQVRDHILTIDPRAKFTEPDRADAHSTWRGPIIAVSDDQSVFAQNLGRSNYALHQATPPIDLAGKSFEIRYVEGQAHTVATPLAKGKGRGER